MIDRSRFRYANEQLCGIIGSPIPNQPDWFKNIPTPIPCFLACTVSTCTPTPLSTVSLYQGIVFSLTFDSMTWTHIFRDNCFLLSLSPVEGNIWIRHMFLALCITWTITRWSSLIHKGSSIYCNPNLLTSLNCFSMIWADKEQTLHLLRRMSCNNLSLYA